ncbi:MAG: radical SAM protein [Alphaproteobacteria bacterium]|nr:radical SAM protein [Alphaproteobacteria bacterium]
MKIQTIEIKDYLVKSSITLNDFVINPYIGCPHACKYCYASYMRRFTNHINEKWGTFLDVKYCNKPIDIKKVIGKSIFISSVTDCYNPYEAKYCITQNILKQLLNVDCNIMIVTKSSLILRDLDLLKQLKSVKVTLSINTLDEQFKNDMDNASSIKDRLNTLKILNENNIYTILFISPIFPGITNYRDIINISNEYVNEYFFENLNLRGDYKYTILKYINDKYPQYKELYNEIFILNNNKYWNVLELDIKEYCNKNSIKYSVYFYHKQFVKSSESNKLNSKFKQNQLKFS